jgi:DNA-binding transcriptional regulator YiaG
VQYSKNNNHARGTNNVATITSLLKSEITRLARKEIRGETAALKKATARYRTEIAALKRRIAALEQQAGRAARAGRLAPAVQPAPDVTAKVRFSAKGFKTLRQRLELSAEAAGRLLDVSAQTIYNWEAGKASPRGEQRTRIAVLRGMGKRDVRAVLAQFGE